MSSRILVFDIDDTLYLERTYVRSGFDAVGNTVSEALGIDGFADECWQLFQSGLRGDVFDRALTNLGRRPTPSFVTTLVTTYRTHEPGISLAVDASDLLRGVLSEWRLAVITDGPAPSQHAKVHALGLRTRFDPIVLTEELGPGCSKPSPAAFEHVEKVTGYQSTECIYVADNPRKDFQAPFRRGWTTARIRRPESLHESVDTGEDVQYEVRDLRELVEPLALLTPGTGRE